MKTYDQRKERVQIYLKKVKARKFAWNCIKTIASTACMAAIIIALLHIPYGQKNAGVKPTDPSTNPTNTQVTEPDTVPTNPTVPTGTEGPVPTDPTESTEPDLREHISVTIWMPDEGMARFTQEQIDRFNQSKTFDVIIDATIEWEEVYNTANRIAQDPENAPDLYCFKQDDLLRLIDLGMLTRLSDSYAQWVRENNLAFTVDTASFDGNVYAFPMSYRNANLLYYDRCVVSDEDAKSLSKIIAACEAAGKKFCFETSNVDNYFPFFLATGCNSVWYRDAEGNPMDVVDNLNSREGVIALQGMLELLNSPARTTAERNGGSSTEIMQEVYGECGAMIVSGGLYGAAIYSEIVGENIGIAMLPSFCVDGTDYQLHTFADCTMMGIKPQKDATKAIALMALAKFLTGEACQYERFDTIYYMVPSNLAALERAKEKEPYISPLVEQSAYAVPKMLIPGTPWWGFTRDIIQSVANGLKAEVALKNYEQRLQDWLNQTQDIWSLTSTVPRSGKWEYYDMTKREDGTWITKAAVYIQEKNLYCFIYNHNDKENYGPNGPNGNSYWESDKIGYFYFVFDPATGDHELIPADT